MKVNGQHYRTLWEHPGERGAINVIDQRGLPHRFEVVTLRTLDEVCRAIQEMWIRGAGLIGATAAYGMAIAAQRAERVHFDVAMQHAAAQLIATRPTAVNLAWAVQQQLQMLAIVPDIADKIDAAWTMARRIADDDAAACRAIGQHGLACIRALAAAKAPGEPVNILTHCNAGWLAFVDYGSALAPIYAAHDAGIPVHVWVDETRPRNQGASLTAWELSQHGVPHHLIVDNAGGHLMQHGKVDGVIVGADRVTRRGDAANKIGTYLKALAAKDNNVPFYVAFPASTFDRVLCDGVHEIPVEERSGEEVRTVSGKTAQGDITAVRICPEATPACNYGFDVTPARLITGLITEYGICTPAEAESFIPA